MAKLKDISKLYVSSVTQQYDAAERLAKEVVRTEIERRKDRLAQMPDAPNAFHTRSEIDLLEAWLNGEERMVAKRRVYDAPRT
jgi:hypothetical protein